MTQLEKARRGEVSSQMETAAARELMSPEQMRDAVAAGRVVIPHNTSRSFPARGIGHHCTTKVNANIGTSDLSSSPEDELEKLFIALESGADAVMDLSTGGKLSTIRRRILEHSPVMVGTVPLYAVMADMCKRGIPLSEMSEQIILAEIQKQAAEGVDFMTLHCGITKRSLSFLQDHPRLAGVVSRGGSFIVKWMEKTGNENPFYSAFDRILALCRSHDVTISLGDGFRPGALWDAGDTAQSLCGGGRTG